jgi:hypothetical protein
MSLYFQLRATRHNLIGNVKIRRTTHAGEPITDMETICTYEVTLDDKLMGEVDHRYGDGPWYLTQKAIMLITYRPVVRINYEPENISRPMPLPPGLRSSIPPDAN